MNTLIAQCGGPTPVINTTLAALIAAWQALPGGGRLWGARHGLGGLVSGDWVDLTATPAAQLARLAQQPAAALGGSRYRPTDAELTALMPRLLDAQIDALCLIGGNGTMAAVGKLAATAAAHAAPLRVIGIPKTIDNDLPGCDVTPGYASAARYLAITAQEIGLDLRAMAGFDQVAIIEAMGRHTGWLTAATALARHAADDPPHILLFPEAPLAPDDLLAAIDRAYAAHGICVIAAAEGVATHDGRYYAEMGGAANQDPSGQRVFSMAAGVSAALAQMVQQTLGLRCRQLRLNTAQRASAALASPLDREIAAAAGVAGLAAARAGQTGVMVSVRLAGASWRTELTPVAEVVGRERRLPAEFIADSGLDVTAAFREYAAPLVAPLPAEPVVWVG